MSDKKNSLKKTENSKSLEWFKDRDYDPLNYLSSEQIRFVQIKTTSVTLSDKKIAELLNVSYSQVKTWLTNDHVINYGRICNKKLHDEDFFNKIKKQNQQLLDKAYVDLISRFEEPNMNELNGQTELKDFERKMYLERYAKNAPFKDAVKAYQTIRDQSYKDLPDEISPVSKFEEEIEVVRKNYQQKITKRISQEESLKKHGYDPTKSLLDNFNDSGTYEVVDGVAVKVEDEDSNAEQISEETISVETFSIRKK